MEKPLLQTLRSEQQNLKHELFRELLPSKCEFIAENRNKISEEEGVLAILTAMKEKRKKRRQKTNQL